MQTFGKRTKEAEVHELKTNKAGPASLWIVGLVVIAIVMIGSINQETATEDGAKCFSGWNGSSAALVQRVKNSLRDPRSFQHVETRYTKTNSAGQIGVRMVYRARNGFGGMVVETAYGTIRASDCALIS